MVVLIRLLLKILVLDILLHLQLLSNRPLTTLLTLTWVFYSFAFPHGIQNGAEVTLNAVDTGDGIEYPLAAGALGRLTFYNTLCNFWNSKFS